MNSGQIRAAFLRFFGDKAHQVTPSAPMVVRNDPTLMFTNAGMNQFKDIFLGNRPASHLRVVNSQKCLRVSGKHNDLEEVGHDTYHHTMFEMLGNWSFGDYFKKEAIAWAWDLLTGLYGLDPGRLYVTVFEGNAEDGLQADEESRRCWKAHVDDARILYGARKDNFWEMGDTGPCGPCSEIHIDLRDEQERKQAPGHSLVNQDHPLVVEIWNLVFIEFNRLKNGRLEPLPAKHVDTGMGFERLCMALQGKKSTYDTDLFQPLIRKLAQMSGKSYGEHAETDVALRVVADHVRAVAFAIADGELPSNNKAGYVIRRILRRAVRYGYTFLGFREAFIQDLIPELARLMGEAFPELTEQQQLIRQVIAEEEAAFLRTLAQGIQKFDAHVSAQTGRKELDGDFVFELFDTYGFPPDLTSLMARERGWTVDMAGFEKNMQAQKARSRAAAVTDAQEWTMLADGGDESVFVGHSQLEAEVSVLKYRRVQHKGKTHYQLVFDQTPFYAESGGQLGDRGWLKAGEEVIDVVDTRKENELTVHITQSIPQQWPEKCLARVDGHRRRLTANNHTATHLLHAALKEVLGGHVQQKGSLVDDRRLRFDFSHFGKMTPDEIRAVESLVNEKIRENIPGEAHDDLPMEEALRMGAAALFGEKYGERVRVVSFDPGFSAELCGGTHVQSTGQIGLFKIVGETAIAAGIRRVEAMTGKHAETWLDGQLEELNQVRALLNHPKNTGQALKKLLAEEAAMKKQIERLKQEQARQWVERLADRAVEWNGMQFVSARISLDAGAAKDLAFALKNKLGDDFFLILGHEAAGKAGLTIMIAESLVQNKGLHAGNMVRELAAHIRGGGGGQAFFATAGGSDPKGLDQALAACRKMLSQIFGDLAT